jgi:hypothetical protein
MATTTNFGWETPDDTDLVKDGAAAIRTALGGVDTSFVDLKGGTTGQILSKASNTDLDFSWSAAGMTNPMTTTGDTIYSSSGSTPARLGIGSTGQVLTVSGGVPSWATPAGGGAYTSLASGSLPTGASTLTLSSISQSYQDLLLVVVGFRTSTNGDYLRMRFNGVTSGTYGSQLNFSSGGILLTDTSMRVMNSANSTSNTGQTNILIENYTATASKFFTGLGINNSATSGEGSMTTTNGGTHTTTAISSITIFSNSTNNFAAGTYTLYGVK